MKLSDRLLEVSKCVNNGGIIADIGTDHGYVPVYLVQNGICPKGIAMDINQGPLSKAKENIEASGLSDNIETRLSDGMKMLKPNEADSIIIAGMGGELIEKIITESMETAKTAKEIILSPHSEIADVRKFLIKHEFSIIDEKMLIDEEKYYVIIKTVYTGIDSICQNENDRKNHLKELSNEYLHKYIKEEQLEYGGILLEKKDQTLRSYLLKEKEKYQSIISKLKNTESEKGIKRISDVEHILIIIQKALEYFDTDLSRKN